jgi:transglutaminase-like putative cysteine protease
MFFEIRHQTLYRYEHPAAEAYIEARLRPPDLPSQRLVSHELRIDPAVATSGYTDHHGNAVEFFSLPFRHSRLALVNRAVVETLPHAIPEPVLATPIQDARQILRSSLPDIYPYLQFGDAVMPGREPALWARRHLAGDRPVGEALAGLVAAIHGEFAYEPGATEISTPTPEVWKSKRGVCQDFAHVLLSVLRFAGLPSRYVCGYIETAAPEGEGGVPALVGSVATHAWVEVLLPGLHWAALDPTNNCPCGEQHIAVAVGQDYRDAAPVRGTFKASGSQEMNVRVTVKRRKPPGAAGGAR